MSRTAATPEDFIQRAAYELGPPAATFKLPPANMNMPPLVDPKNVYSEIAAGKFSPATAGALQPRLRAQPHHRQGRRHRPRDVQGGRQLSSPFPARSTSCRRGICRRCGFRATSAIAAATPRSLPIDPKTGKLGQDDRRARRLQHVFHPRRPFGDRRRRGEAAAGVPRSADDGAAGLYRRAAVRRHQPRRFLARRLLRDLHLRVRRQARQDRPRPPHARRHAAALARPHPAGHPHRARRLGVLRRRHAQGRARRDRRRRVQGDRLHPDRRRRARALSQPRRQAALSSPTAAPTISAACTTATAASR